MSSTHGAMTPDDSPIFRHQKGVQRRQWRQLHRLFEEAKDLSTQIVRVESQIERMSIRGSFHGDLLHINQLLSQKASLQDQCSEKLMQAEQYREDLKEQEHARVKWLRLQEITQRVEVWSHAELGMAMRKVPHPRMGYLLGFEMGTPLSSKELGSLRVVAIYEWVRRRNVRRAHYYTKRAAEAVTRRNDLLVMRS